MCEQSHNQVRTYIPADCVKCRYPLDPDMCAHGEPLRCPECGHELTPIRMRRSDFNRWIEVVSAIGLFCGGQVCFSLATVFLWVFFLLFDMADTVFVIVAGTLVGTSLFMLMPVAVALSKHSSSWLSATMMLAWLFNACAWFVWMNYSLTFDHRDLRIKTLILTVVGLVVIQIVPWRLSKWHPLPETSRRIRRLCIYAVSCVAFCPALYVLIWSVLGPGQREFWLEPLGYPVCLGTLVVVVAPAFSLLIQSSNWEQLIEVEPNPR
jgi:phosphotransferase system  glucose/maltose/N-acetylglucosamine-specific IIC component